MLMPGEIRWVGKHFAFLKRRVVLGCVELRIRMMQL